MLSDTDEHREVVLGCGAIRPVSAMLSSDDTSVVQAAMKTTMHFVNKSVK
jgi:Armadillo/beta-catenin-like repeat